MQDNERENQTPDDDILQCKAELRGLIDAMGKSGSEKSVTSLSSKDEASFPDLKSVEKEDIFLEAELDGADAAVNSIPLPNLVQDDILKTPEPPKDGKKSLKHPVDPGQQQVDNKKNEEKNIVEQLNQQLESVAAQRVQLESKTQKLLQKLQLAYQESGSLKLQLEQEITSRHRLQKDLEESKKELQEKTLLVNQQKQRFEFLNKQLQNAIVLEREKSRLQGETQNLNNKNQQLIAEITQLKNRLEDLYQTDSQVQNLRKSLESAESALSEQQALAHQAEQTSKTLKEKLAVHKQDVQNFSEKLIQKEQELAQLKSAYEQLQEEHLHFHEHKEGELSNMAEGLKELKEQYHQQQIDAEQMRHEYEAFQTQANGELRLLTENNDLLKNENRTLSEEIKHLKEEKQYVKDISEKLRDIELDLENASDNLQKERESSKELRQEQEHLKSAISEAQREKEELSNRLQMLQSTEGQLREELNRLRESAAGNAVQDELAAAQQEINRLHEQNQSLEKQLQDIQQTASSEPEETVLGSVVSPIESTDEQVAGNDTIPAFNLAEQIMEEHRRSVANRRQRVKPTVAASQGHSIKNVIQHYVHSSSRDEVSQDKKSSSEHHLWTDQSLTPFQQEILREIVRNDMEFYSHKKLTMAEYLLMNN